LYYYPDFISKKETKTYDLQGNSPIVNEESYIYNSNNLVFTTVKGKSDGKKVKTQIFYPDDVLNTSSLNGEELNYYDYESVYKLKSAQRHQIATPIQIETYHINTDNTEELLSTKRMLYKEENGIVLPKAVQMSLASDPLQIKANYHKYDTVGNPIEVSKEKGIRISYIWGYEKIHPIAKIEKATYSEIATALNLTTEQLLNLNESDTDMVLINSLRQLLPNAMVSTYEYKALVGLTKMTDPRGYVSNYSYDSANRLKYIKDVYGNILKMYKYNYKD